MKTFVSLVFAAGVSTAGAAELAKVDPDRAVAGEYVVVLKEGAAVKGGTNVAGLTTSQVAVDMAARYGGSVLHVYESALHGLALRLDTKAVGALLADPRVALVEQSQVYEPVQTSQSPATWGLDRVDQRNLPLNNRYTYNFNGQGVHAYVIDTGIRATHREFTGRVGNGATFVNDGRGTGDCNGHGSHVSGTFGGTTYGVAKRVTLHPVRVFGCAGGASTPTIIAAVDWVTANHVKPAVANMSLGGPVSSTMDQAVANSIGAGVTYVVAAGNESQAACNRSPARVPAAITVGATTRTDARAGFSNFGTCVDVFAPGDGVTSAWYTSDTATNTIPGTSMASPHVAGAAALYLDQVGNRTPAAVSQAVVANATTGKVTNAGSGSPNRLLYTLFGGGGGGTPPPPDSVSVRSEFCRGLNTASWSAVAGATSYQAFHFFSSTATTGGVLFHNGPQTQKFFSVTGTRYVRVKACNASGCSALSSDYGIARYHSGPCL